LDSCAHHTINAGKKCHVKVAFSPIQAVGTTETTNIYLEGSTGGTIGVDEIDGLVQKDSGLVVVASGLVITIKNPTAMQSGMDFETFGGVSIDNNASTCKDIIFPHRSCTLQVVQSGPGSAEIEIFSPDEEWDFSF
jgi:hypothetical protein